MRTDIQIELDSAEEYILTKLFGSVEKPIISPKIRTILKMLNIDFDSCVNMAINYFENSIKPYFKENGLLDGENISNLVANKIPILQGLKIPDMRLKDLIKILEQFLPVEKIGLFIQNL